MSIINVRRVVVHEVKIINNDIILFLLVADENSMLQYTNRQIFASPPSNKWEGKQQS